MMFWVGVVWAAPISLLGLLVAFVTSRKVGTRNGALICASYEWFQRLFFDRFNVQAFCWAQVIILRDNTVQSWDAVGHELVHFKQARLFGPLMPIAYLVGMAVAWLRSGRPYRDCFLEAQARRESGT